MCSIACSKQQAIFLLGGKTMSKNLVAKCKCKLDTRMNIIPKTYKKQTFINYCVIIGMVMKVREKYKFSEEDYRKIKEARRRNRDKQTDKRLQVLELRCEGTGLVEIANITGFHRSHVSNLIRKYFEEGMAAVAEKHYQGNRRNMSLEDERHFLEQFREKAERGQVLDIHEIKAAYEKEVGHSIGGSQVYRVLHRHGWRKIMPRSRHPKKADAEVIEASKKLTAKSNG